MEKMTDWLTLWKELSALQSEAWGYTKHREKGEDAWKDRARKFNERVKKRWSRPDTSRDFMIGTLHRNPGSTLVDIGAGTGSWTVLLAKHAAGVTAVEPSAAMAEVMNENVEAAGLENVTLNRGEWPGLQIEVHDYSLASHSMYGCGDFRAFVEKMMAVTRRRCFLLLRAPVPDSIMALASSRILGQPHDSPNFQVAYNALLQMGLFPNVLMEPELWDPWRHESLETALKEVKNRLGVAEDAAHDAFLSALLTERLTRQADGHYAWPKETRSALVYWDVP
jgi:SAM-dependent methyltransferase